MGLFSTSKSKSKVNWELLIDSAQLDEFLEKSNQKPVMLFKHSTRCGISSMAKNRLETDWHKVEEQIIPVYLDLLTYRSISNEIADRFDVVHQSPQIILLKDGKSIYNASHSAISVQAIKDLL